MSAGLHPQELRARAAVVAVPLTQLKASRIAFAPPLPPPMRDTIAAITVENAVKVSVPHIAHLFFIIRPTMTWNNSEHLYLH